MNTLSAHSSDHIRGHSVYEYLRTQVAFFYAKVREIAETEDIVLIFWGVLVVYLVYTGYTKFSQCGEIIGLYKQLRF